MTNNLIENEEKSNKPDPFWPLFFKQSFICFGTVVIYFNFGLFFAAPPVFIAQMRREMNSSAVISVDMETWLNSAITYVSIPWTVLLPIIAHIWGRKKPTIILWIFMTISAIVLLVSTSVEGFAISLIMQGIIPATPTLSTMILTECTIPKYRGIFMTLKNATFFWGIWATNSIGTFYHWKVIVIIIITICCILSAPIIYWPESPYWLASKGRFEDCARTHRWLKGTSEDAEKDLNYLISCFEEKISRQNEKLNLRQQILKILNIIKLKVFYKPLIYGFLANALHIFSGKLTCSVYAVGIIKQMTNSELAGYVGLLVMDGFNLFGMYLGCLLSKFLNRKTLLLGTSTIAVIVLFTLSIYFYVIKLSYIKDSKYVSISLLTLFSMSVSCGPVLLAPCILGELTPLKYRCTFIAASTLLMSLSMGIIIKISPFLFAHLHIYGTFLLLGIITSVISYFVYKYVPETKDKTLSEIQAILEGNETGTPEERKNMFSK